MKMKKPTTAATKKKPHEKSVEELLGALSHPLKKDIELVRKIVLSADKKISEGIKWNTLSFKTSDYFAAVHLRSTDEIQLVFHTGAKVKATATTGINISDPSNLCRWLAKDRCLVSLGTGQKLMAKRKAFEALIHEWIKWV
jgi:Domain of unknown function (DU1801)